MKRPFRISIPEPSQRGVFLPVSTPNAADALLMPGPQESTQPSTSTLVDARACRVVPQKRVCFEIVMPPSPQEGYRISLETSGIASGVRLLCRVNGAARCSLTAKAHDRKTFALEVPAAWLVAGRNDFRFVQLDPASRAIEVASFVAEPLGPPPQVAPARRREPTIPARASAAFAAMNGSWTAGNLPDVLRRADEVLRAAPHFAPALARRAEALHRLGRWSQAIETFQEAIRYDLHDASLWDDLGMTLNDRGRLEEARRLLTHALRLAPDGYWHWHNLALVESRSGEPDAALRHLDLSLEIDPRGKESLADKAQIHQDRGETGLAREVWEQVLAIDPKHDRARNTLFKLDHAKPPE
ncbi:MAG: tetratricopeptide repeat protein [Candidatus Riflebacteria bacterium]|nr:tetratricopeptide repeat protein [Candidatus Riflebacteria bacterium]